MRIICDFLFLSWGLGVSEWVEVDGWGGMVRGEGELIALVCEMNSAVRRRSASSISAAQISVRYCCGC